MTQPEIPPLRRHDDGFARVADIEPAGTASGQETLRAFRPHRHQRLAASHAGAIDLGHDLHVVEVLLAIEVVQGSERPLEGGRADAIRQPRQPAHLLLRARGSNSHFKPARPAAPAAALILRKVRRYASKSRLDIVTSSGAV